MKKSTSKNDANNAIAGTWVIKTGYQSGKLGIMENRYWALKLTYSNVDNKIPEGSWTPDTPSPVLKRGEWEGEGDEGWVGEGRGGRGGEIIVN